VRAYGGVSAEERIAARREMLLEAALEEFGTRGFASTGVKDICSRAKLTDRYFYESFRDSRELFLAVFDRATARLYDVVVDGMAAAPPTASERARGAIGAYVRALADDPRVARIVFVEAPAAGPEAERHMRETLRRFAVLVEHSTRDFLPKGVPDLAMRFGALSFVGAIERVMIEWQDGQLDMPVEQIVDYLVALLMLGGTVASQRR
jgi:AcrR family transcriptional regulator